MQDQFFSRIREDMDVFDVAGEKVGKVGKLYQPAQVTPSTTSYAEPAGRAYLKVDTGFLGLGKDLYIPTSAVSDVMADRVVLNVDKHHLDDMGWDERPGWIED